MKVGVNVKSDYIFFQRYGMDWIAYADKLHKQGYTIHDAMNEVNRIMRQIYEEKISPVPDQPEEDNDFYEFKGNESDLPFII
ncbi:MAG: hypothetical protein MR384_00545 [Lachnospiraceae bacterium]|nr:hypothetical protein [Lachnospiraceae bacterium]